MSDDPTFRGASLRIALSWGSYLDLGGGQFAAKRGRKGNGAIGSRLLEPTSFGGRDLEFAYSELKYREVAAEGVDL